ncbi:SRPBCC domain-containing protein [Mycobacterium sp.]|uniref:SRPBCC domain-containing protein n=1 Tax=Mycobacterium sp. TaxID=1785 RepID=UPI002B81F532|nr:SRPBCC domain-containing protein [Mycobacterium sp.]HTY35057.1 SRPBCC domain-containing protein [Mycobacterium sp.]
MGRTDTASLVVDAPLSRVYAALIQPQALVEWLPPRGMSGEFEYFDARTGGSYRMKLTYAEAPESGGKSGVDSDVVDVRFVEVVPDDRVVQAVDFQSDDPLFAETMTMTWTVTAVSTGSTRVDVRADDVPEGISAGDHVDGLRSSLKNLATYLTRPRAYPD